MTAVVGELSEDEDRLRLLTAQSPPGSAGSLFPSFVTSLT
jgi:hypothetical protein